VTRLAGAVAALRLGSLFLATLNGPGPADVSWDRIHYVGGALSTRVAVSDNENAITLLPLRLILRLADHQTLEIPTRAVTFLGYTREAVPDNGVIGLPALGAPIPIFYMGWVKKTGQHYIAIEYTRTEGGSARVVLQADKKNYVQLVTALSAASGVPVSMSKADRKYFPAGFVGPELTQPLKHMPGVASWRLELFSGHRKGIASIEFSPDGHLLATAFNDGTIAVWDVVGRKALWEPPKEGQDANNVAFAPGARLLASWHTFKNRVLVWDVATHEITADIQREKGTWIRHAAFSPDGQTLAVLEEHSQKVGHVVRLWRLAGLQDRGEFHLDGDGSRATLSYSADGATLFYWSRTGQVNAWDIPSGRRMTAIRGVGERIMALDRTAPRLAVNRYNRTLDLWDLDQQRPEGSPLAGHFGNVTGASFSADGRRIASMAEGHAVVWDIATHQAIGQCSWGAAGAGSEVTLSPDGAVVAMSSSDDPTIALCVAPVEPTPREP